MEGKVGGRFDYSEGTGGTRSGDGGRDVELLDVDSTEVDEGSSCGQWRTKIGESVVVLARCAQNFVVVAVGFLTAGGEAPNVL